MKTAPKLLLLLLILLSGSTFADAVASKATVVPNPVETVAVVPSKYKNLFVFKVAREFKGAMVEIYSSNGDLVASKPLDKRKMVINFCDVKSGTYTIRIKKNNRMEEFQFVRK